MQEMYYYRTLAALPHMGAMDFIKKNAGKHGWGPYTRKNQIWRFTIENLPVRLCGGNEVFQGSGESPLGFVTEKPLSANKPDTHLAQLIRYSLMLFEGLYVAEFSADRMTIEEWHAEYADESTYK